MSYEYDFSYQGLPFVAKLPVREWFSPRYLAHVAEVDARLAANRAAAKLHMFPQLPAPLAVAHGTTDESFAWQRLAGPCPVVIRRLEADIPALLLDDGLRARLAAGELYVCDYAVWQHATVGVTDGVAKHVEAPIALFGTVEGPYGLAPLAIQVGGHGGGPETRFTPGNGVAWENAKLAVQVADENFQAAIAHVGWCHMVAEVLILSARRQLPDDHPLMALWAPHFEFTLAVNTVTRDPVVAPGGDQDTLLAPTLEWQLQVLRDVLAEADYAGLDPVQEFTRRAVMDLPVYPFRDDGLPIWGAILVFVRSYVGLYYTSDAQVAGDPAIQAFLTDVAVEGRMPRLVEPVGTIDALVDLASRVIYRVTAFHAGINDPNYDWAGYLPCMPPYTTAPIPSTIESAALLPSEDVAWAMVKQTYSVANIKANRLGEYPRFADARVGPLVEAFQAALAAVDADTAARDAGRPVPYVYLRPSRMTASINA